MNFISSHIKLCSHYTSSLVLASLHLHLQNICYSWSIFYYISSSVDLGQAADSSRIRMIDTLFYRWKSRAKRYAASQSGVREGCSRWPFRSVIFRIEVSVQPLRAVFKASPDSSSAFFTALGARLMDRPRKTGRLTIVQPSALMIFGYQRSARVAKRYSTPLVHSELG